MKNYLKKMHSLAFGFAFLSLIPQSWGATDPAPAAPATTVPPRLTRADVNKNISKQRQDIAKIQNYLQQQNIEKQDSQLILDEVIRTGVDPMITNDLSTSQNAINNIASKRSLYKAIRKLYKI